MIEPKAPRKAFFKQLKARWLKTGLWFEGQPMPNVVWKTEYTRPAAYKADNVFFEVPRTTTEPQNAAEDDNFCIKIQTSNGSFYAPYPVVHLGEVVDHIDFKQQAYQGSIRIKSLVEFDYNGNQWVYKALALNGHPLEKEYFLVGESELGLTNDQRAANDQGNLTAQGLYARAWVNAASYFPSRCFARKGVLEALDVIDQYNLGEIYRATTANFGSVSDMFIADCFAEMRSGKPPKSIDFEYIWSNNLALWDNLRVHDSLQMERIIEWLKMPRPIPVGTLVQAPSPCSYENANDTIDLILQAIGEESDEKRIISLLVEKSPDKKYSWKYFLGQQNSKMEYACAYGEEDLEIIGDAVMVPAWLQYLMEKSERRKQRLQETKK